MATLFRWLFRGVLLLFGLICLAGLSAYYFAAKSIPDYTADRQVAGVERDVEIVRDTHGVPHIFGATDRDVHFALGYVHAQDRLWQMEVARRTAQGRLSEMFGTSTVRIDEFIRRLDLHEISRLSLAHQTPDTRQALDAYAAGVNAWLRTVSDEALGRGAPEFFVFGEGLLGSDISPWTAADSLSIIKLMALRLSTHLQDEITRARLSLVLDSAMVGDIMPVSPGKAFTALPDYAEFFPGVVPEPPVKVARLPESGLDPVRPPGLGGASNVWAAQPSRSASGASLFASDPHLELSAPGIWMLARLEFPDGSAIGGTLPGIPAVLIGRNRHIAWGIAAAHVDDLDVYVEKLNPDDPGEYLSPAGYQRFRSKRVIVGVRGQESRTLDLLWTERGPVIPNHLFELGRIMPEGHVASIAWTALDAADSSMSAAIKLMQATNAFEARNAGRLFRAPAQNLVVAEEKTVAIQTVGSIPLRAAGHVTRGQMPSPGWMPENHWQGRLSYARSPFRRNPPSGIVANTNNRTTDAPFPFHISHAWGDSQRIERLNRLMNGREVHTRDSFVETQLDVVSFTARSLLPLIARDLWYADDPAPAGTLERKRQEALDLLAKWNGEMDSHLPEPLIYAAWMRNLQIRLAEDELGGLIEEIPRPVPVFIERVFRDFEGAARWCDVQQTSRIETCQEISRQALDAALIELTEEYGDRITSWRWGLAHQAHHDHAALGRLPILSWFSNIRQETSGGDNTLQRGGMSGTGDTPYASIHAAGLRVVVDFSDPDSSLYVISTGQSGHPFSRHYDDLAQLWRRGEYIPMSLDPEFARSASTGVTWLRPAPR